VLDRSREGGFIRKKQKAEKFRTRSESEKWLAELEKKKCECQKSGGKNIVKSGGKERLQGEKKKAR